MTTPVISVIGWHDVGKTTFLVGLIGELKRRGLRVVTVKHARQHFCLDRPGTDTWRFAQAGSDVVVISGKGRMALIEHCPEDEEISLSEIVARLPEGIDLVITEGYKGLPTPKIVVARAGVGQGPIAALGEVLALVTGDVEAEAGEGVPLGGTEGVPVFAPADVAGVVDLLVARGFVRPEGR